MIISEIKDRLIQAIPDLEITELENTIPAGFLIPVSKLRQVSLLLRDTEGIYMDLLSCISAVDNGFEAGTMDVLYHLYSVTNELSMTLKVQLDRDEPVVDSLADIWRAADWHEREAFDLMGVRFDGHPDLRRILLPQDWVGHPLRKDYTDAEKYHGITITYDREDS